MKTLIKLLIIVGVIVAVAYFTGNLNRLFDIHNILLYGIDQIKHGYHAVQQLM